MANIEIPRDLIDFKYENPKFIVESKNLTKYGLRESDEFTIEIYSIEECATYRQNFNRTSYYLIKEISENRLNAFYIGFIKLIKKAIRYYNNETIKIDSLTQIIVKTGCYESCICYGGVQEVYFDFITQNLEEYEKKNMKKEVKEIKNNMSIIGMISVTSLIGVFVLFGRSILRH